MSEPLIDVGYGDWIGTEEPTVSLKLAGIADQLTEALLRDSDLIAHLHVAYAVRGVLPGSMQAYEVTNILAEKIAEALQDGIDIPLTDALDLSQLLDEMRHEFPTCLRSECDHYAQPEGSGGLCLGHAERAGL